MKMIYKELIKTYEKEYDIKRLKNKDTSCYYCGNNNFEPYHLFCHQCGFKIKQSILNKIDKDFDEYFK